MQSEHQHIDEFFRTKEEEWDADSNDLQQHWQQMLILMPTAGAGIDSKPSYYRLLKLAGKIIGSVVTLAVLVAVVIILSKRDSVIAEKKSPKNEAAVAVVAEPTLKQDTVSTVQANPSSTSASASATAPAPVQEKLLPRRRNNASVSNTDTTVAVADLVKPDAATMMKEFYGAIQKQSEAFTVAADRDTIIKGKEGTVLTIKAFSFSDDSGPVRNGDVRIRLTEYYKNDDIVAAKLSTTSDGEQLVTGGMIHLAAEKNGRPVKVAAGRSIELKMPTNDYDGRMELFADARQVRQNVRSRGNSDTIQPGSDFDGSLVNWVSIGQSQMIFLEEGRNGISLLDLSVDPYRVRYGQKTVARFFYDKDIKLDKDELREQLYRRYGTYYDKIILRKAGKRVRGNTIDTVSMSFQEAIDAKLLSKADSTFYAQKKMRDSVNNSKKQKALKYYTYLLPQTGWYNCDYFARDPRPKTNFTLDLGEGNDAAAFVTQLVFTRVRTTILGYGSGNKVRFTGIPANEPVMLVCAGMKDGKMVSFIAAYNTSAKQVEAPVFTETSAEAFREKLQTVNTPIAPR